MKKSIFTIILLVLITTIALLSIYFVTKNREEDFNKQKEAFLTKQSLPNSNIQKVEYDCELGLSAFEILDQKYNIEAGDSNLGKFVTSIEGAKQGDGKYWLYSVDGKEATISASTYTCQGNEKIVWELK